MPFVGSVASCELRQSVKSRYVSSLMNQIIRINTGTLPNFYKTSFSSTNVILPSNYIIHDFCSCNNGTFSNVMLPCCSVRCTIALDAY
jgi:hypothetical protein